MFKLTIETENPAVLVAIANAVKNTPPLGFQSSSEKPIPINVHASIKDMKAAKDNLVLAPNTTVQEVPNEEPPSPPAPIVDPLSEEAAKDKGQDIRKLLLAVSKLDGHDIQTAKAVAAKAAGIDPSGINKDFPTHPKADDAIKALKALVE